MGKCGQKSEKGERIADTVSVFVIVRLGSH